MSEPSPKLPAERRRVFIAFSVAAAAVLACIALIALQLREPGPPRRAPPIEARLELAAGAVTLATRAGTSSGTSGAALPADARLSTGPGARALARLSDGSAVLMRSDSAVHLGSEAVELTAGEAWIDAPPTDREAPTYRVGAASITATDAGLSLQREGDTVTVYVARGLAVVTAPGGRVEAQGGEEIIVEGDGAPQVRPVAWWDDWTGGMADNRTVGDLAGSGAGTLYGVDFGAPAGSSAQTLEMSRLSVRATLRAGLAETEVDQTFANSSSRDLEGWYWFTVPPGATVTSFAVEHDGRLVDGEFSERRQASGAYTRAAQTGHAPAILEWIDSRTFRARIYPVPAMGQRRVVLRYLEVLRVPEGVVRYTYPLQSPDPVRIGEFSLVVDLGDEGRSMEIATLADARIEDGGRLVTMRRSGFVPLADFQLEGQLPHDVPPMRVARFATGSESADFVMLRYTPDVDWDAHTARRADVVVVVDTSAAGDDTDRQLKAAAAEAILRALSADDRFALMALDVDARVLHPAEGLAEATDDHIATAQERLAEHAHGGATDLGAFFDKALGRLHEAEQPAVVYIGDGLATAGELSGDQLRERLRRALSTSKARLFTISVGTDANQTLLSELARAGGGHTFAVGNRDQATETALRLAAALKMPTITDLRIDAGAGLDQVFVTGGGKASRGDEIVLLARTHNPLPTQISVRGTLGTTELERTYKPVADDPVAGAFAPRFWARERMMREIGAAADPEDVRGQVSRIGIEYGLMTPFTSIIWLENDAAYRRMGIQRTHRPLRGLRLAQVDSSIPLVWLRGAIAPALGGCMGMESPSPVVADELASVASPATVVPPADLDYAEESKEGPAEPVVLPGASHGRGSLGRVEGEEEDFKAVARKPQEVRDTTVSRGGGDKGQSREQQARRASGSCSDWARRPLSDRIRIWRKRLSTAAPGDLVGRYSAAQAACELDDWRSESAFLQLMVQRIHGPAQATSVLRAGVWDTATQQHIARLILRGAVDERTATAVNDVILGAQVDWAAVDRELSEIADVDARIEALRVHVARAPDDARGTIRLIRLLSKGNRAEEMLVLARRLQDRGMVTPLLARDLGDVLAARGLSDEAIRSYSEIVEFHADSPQSRRMLGGIYLAHGWYGPAYRQFETLADDRGDGTSDLLRLAMAAAGEGRVDEALRLERKVASAPGRPGASDPRAWARLWSAARLADLLAEPPDEQSGSMATGLRRQLKELQLFRAPGTLVIVTWEDLDADLDLSTLRDGTEAMVGDPVNASEVGLASVLLPRGELGRLELRVERRGMPADRPLEVVRHDLTWDGKAFQVDRRVAQVIEGASGAAL